MLTNSEQYLGENGGAIQVLTSPEKSLMTLLAAIPAFLSGLFMIAIPSLDSKDTIESISPSATPQNPLHEKEYCTPDFSFLVLLIPLIFAE